MGFCFSEALFRNHQIANPWIAQESVPVPPDPSSWYGYALNNNLVIQKGVASRFPPPHPFALCPDDHACYALAKQSVPPNHHDTSPAAAAAEMVYTLGCCKTSAGPSLDSEQRPKSLTKLLFKHSRLDMMRLPSASSCKQADHFPHGQASCAPSFSRESRHTGGWTAAPERMSASHPRRL